MIEVKDVTRRYGETVAVDHLSFTVRPGIVTGFLGPNGAGKTTSMKMLLGLIAPTSGEATLLGKPIGNQEAMRRVGFLPEHFRFQEWLSADEFLLLHGQLLGMQTKDLQGRRDELLERVGLTPFRNKHLRTFSKGMLQRVGLAQALLNRPALVFLDEPTSGLDPVGRRLVRDVIREVRAQGTSVFLNSHLLSEIEVTCDRVAFIQHGEVVRLLELSSLSSDQTSVTIRVSNLAAESLSGLSEWGREIQVDGEFVHMLVANDAVLPEVTRYLISQKAEVYAITPNRMSLEDIFIETVGKDGGL